MRNSFCRVCLIVAGLLAPAAASAQGAACLPSPNGLVGWWPGNGTANDTVGANNGQLFGDAAFAAGMAGEGFRLDGFGDYVEIPDAAALKPPHVAVEAWVRFDSLDTPIVSTFGVPGLQYVIFKKNTRTFNFEAYALRKERVAGIDRFAFSVADVNGFGGTNVARSQTVVETGRFYHVVGTYDGFTVRLFVDGELEGASSVSLTVDYGARPVFIGTSGETVFDGKLHGIVDEASVYNRALDAWEVASLFAAGSAGKCGTVTGLITGLSQLVQSSNLSMGIANSLDAKLENAMRALDAAMLGDTPAACGMMGAFLNQVAAQSGGLLTGAQASQMSRIANDVRAALSCR
jgi:hypothetical protein